MDKKQSIKVDGVSFNTSHYSDKTKEEFVKHERHHFKSDEKAAEAFDTMFPDKKARRVRASKQQAPEDLD